jgi:hypothetical protein
MAVRNHLLNLNIVPLSLHQCDTFISVCIDLKLGVKVNNDALITGIELDCILKVHWT